MKITAMGRVFVLLGGITLSGCAYLNTYNNEMDLKGKSVAMDMKQRVIYSQERFTRQRDKEGKPIMQLVMCAEPSPDALSAYAASIGLGVNTNTGQTANLAAGGAETSAFTGLRTQSIQLLRDAMYRLCEGYASGAVTEDDYAAMQRRYQSTMMGLIAIEQLTGPVLAGQALLTSAATGQAGASASDTVVDKAQEHLDAAKEKHLTTQTRVDEKTTQYNNAKTERDKLKYELSQKEAEDKPNNEEITRLQQEISNADNTIQGKKDELNDAKRRERDAHEGKREAKDALRKAQAKVSSSASTAGSLSAIANASANSAQHLTEGVVNIVAEINESYTKDACLILLSRSMETLHQPGKDPGFFKNRRDTLLDKTLYQTLRVSLDVCKNIFEAERKKWKLQASK
uniref:Lipoprotein n=1 Tax=Candidatus Kentrum sp. TC TaxID=2126339 RepID=A0A451A7B1_9GAMM|nr:MAG: hypothetical protein BECKTC1821F_GA0114240_10656 [Candidatus Kentron sp. TC]